MSPGASGSSPGSQTSSFRIVVFDLGGVLVRIARTWDEAHALAGLLPGQLPPDLGFRNAIIELVDAYDLGAITPEDFAHEAAAASGGSYSADEIHRIHHAISMTEYPGVGAVLDTIEAAGLATGVLSNTNPAHWPRLIGETGDVPEYPTVARTIHRHASHLLRVAKPDPRIYATYSELTGFPPESILFFDDREENVRGARAAGWTAHHIDHTADTAAQLLAHLRSHGIPPL